MSQSDRPVEVVVYAEGGVERVGIRLLTLPAGLGFGGYCGTVRPPLEGQKIYELEFPGGARWRVEATQAAAPASEVITVCSQAPPPEF